MALNGLFCADVPLRTYSLSLFVYVYSKSFYLLINVLVVQDLA